ncbi:helix-turn-helix domain-containing protein [Hoeflea sp.]|uniref:AraC family transcriptional regulator n=1 Tax=Hoeflea sp. TaxID=1940281 RepID=UPI003B01CDC1
MSKALGVFVGRFGRVALLSADEPVSEHAHSQLHVLIKIDGADGFYDVGGEVAPITDDQMVTVNPWVPHQNPRVSKAPATVLLALYLEPVWLGMVDKSITLGRTNSLFADTNGRVSDDIRRLAHEIADLIRDSIGQEEFLEDLLLSLMREIVNRFCDQSLGYQLPQPKRQIDYRIRKAAKFMRDHANKTLELDEVASHAGLSRSRFYEQFRSCIGVSPRVYLDALCIEAAMVELSSRDRSLADISETLGFSAQSHFTRFFRSKMGVPPSDVRNVIYDLVGTRQIRLLKDERL